MFECNCEEVHCSKPKQIFLKICEVKEDKIGEENEFDTALFCNKPQPQEFPSQGTSEADSHSKAHVTTTACNSNEVDIDKIIMQGLVKPSNPGVIQVP